MPYACIRAIAGVVAATLLSGCATLVHQTKQSVSIASTPAGATVAIDQQPHGLTPLMARLKRKQDHVVEIELAGYQPYEIRLTRNVSGWFFGNILLGGLIGIAIDGLTGSMYKLKPKQIAAELQKEDHASLLDEDALYLAVVLQPDPTWQKIGQLDPSWR